MGKRFLWMAELSCYNSIYVTNKNVMNNKHIYFFIGTTAELIKLAPVIRELERRKMEFKIIASNQNILHFEEVGTLISKRSADYTFRMKPYKWPKDIYLRFIIWFVKSLGNYFIYFRNEFRGKNKNSYFIVHGDTVTSVIGALIAKLCQVKPVHIESGLRSFSFFEPFPEELSRFITSHLADISFCPNKWAADNLKNHKGAKINTFYNTIGESTRLSLKSSQKVNFPMPKLKKYFIFVVHRQEHTLFNKMDTEKVIELVTREAKDDLKCIFVMHQLTKDYLKKQNLFKVVKNNPNVILPPRLPYLSFINLMRNAEFIATDGGSNQEEAYFLGLPCLILRNRTERIEGLGENAVISFNKESLMKDFFKNYKEFRRPTILNFKTRPSSIIVDYLLRNK